MFFRKNQPTNQVASEGKQSKIIIKIDGLHCTSCSLLIDNTLEDVPGVISSSTSYAKSECAVVFDPARGTVSQIEDAIQGLGYQVVRSVEA